MKLPRYLQIALALSCALSLWQFFSVPETQPVTSATTIAPAPTTGSAPRVEPTATGKNNTLNLFPFQGDKAEPPPVVMPKMAVPSTPPLPFQVNGAWWDQHQRALVLTDGIQQWIICRQCRARDKIWIGANLGQGWQLVEVGADFLTFRWLPQKRSAPSAG